MKLLGLSSAARKEIERIQALPVRDWRETAKVDAMTEALRTPGGSQKLRPIQAAALEEAYRLRGVFVHGRVGCGKTLIAALLPTVWGCKRPLLVVRGADVQDTRTAHRELRKHWQVLRSIRVVSYNFLSDPKNEGWLERNRIDGIVLDEAQKAKDIKKAACAIRINRFVIQNPSIPVAALSGTLSPHGDLDHYAHLLLWCLRRHAPIPQEPGLCKVWGRVLRGAGDPSRLLGAWDHIEAEERFADRLKSSPGVIISQDVFDGVPLSVSFVLHDASEASRPHYERLRTLWEAPDGWAFCDDSGEAAFQTAEIARQFANGFWYGHDPRPPKWFLEKRKAWAGFCYRKIESGAADSEGSIKSKIEAGRMRDGETLLKEWRDAQERFPLKTKAEWIDLEAVRYAKEWIEREGAHGIVWVQHIEVGKILERVTGCKFFHGQPGRNILKESGARCVIASIQHAGTSKNLQYAFWKNLLLNPPANGEAIEQLLGRTHRENQTHEVSGEFFISCREHRNAVIQSIRAAEKISGTLSPQKMRGLQYPPNSQQDHPAWKRAIPLKR